MCKKIYRIRLLTVLVTSAVGAAGMAGCGGGSDSSSSASASMSRAQFVTAANKICARGRTELNNRLVSFQKKNGSLNPSDPGDAAVEAILLPVMKPQVTDLEALEPPSQLAAEFVEFLQVRKHSLTLIEVRELSSNAELLKAFERSDRLAYSLALDQCSYS